MCGRYTLFSDEEVQDLRDIIEEVERRHRGGPLAGTGEIRPTNIAPVVVAGADGPEARAMAWGFPPFRGKGVIINARAETAADKPLFRGSLGSRRCAVPATGFYEWDDQKVKHRFSLPGEPFFYLAGLYGLFDREPHFVILTTAPNRSVAAVHDRMPVLLPPFAVEGWLSDPAPLPALLAAQPPSLTDTVA
jgi:putative SOS response-associated peptidase YedK